MKSKILNYTVILQKETDGGYTVTVPTLAGCITYGKDVEEAKKMAIEAIELYLESLKEHNEEIPEEIETYYTQVSVSPSVSHA
jgi:predicted RNase H-like HicB family nuclease